jgi:hypothetical protein
MHLLVIARRQGADYRLACAASQQKRRADVRFGSKADMCTAKRHVRFPPTATSIASCDMSALGQKRTSGNGLPSALLL